MSSQRPVEVEAAETAVPRWSPWLIAGAVVALVVAVVLLRDNLVRLAGEGSFDLNVYRGALGDFLSGKSLYKFYVVGHGTHYPFTYPPFAGLVMAPLGMWTYAPVRAVWAAIQYALVALLVVLVRRRTPAARYGWGVEGWLITVLSFCAVALNETFTEGVALGQMSLAVVALVLVDFLALPPKWRGTLVGIAAAIKLTPLIFLPYFAITRQWRALVNATVATAGAAAVGYVVLPADSKLYWTKLLFDTSRVGDPTAWRNKSLLGLLSHFNIGGPLQHQLWLALVLVISVVAFWQAWRCFRRGEELAAALVVGTLSTVVSPISWVHHLVWIPLIAIYLVMLARRGPTLLGAGLLVTLITGSIFIGFGTGNLVDKTLGDVICLVLLSFALFGLPRRSSVGTTRSPVL
jgi:alpha-1,2-mannosyltransferase